MPKIKDIHERLVKNPVEYNELSLLVAKRVLAFAIAFYFTSFLFTVGGFSFGPFSLSILSQISFHAYSLLILVVAWFLYSLLEYGLAVYAPNRHVLKYGVGVFLILFVGIALFAHFTI